MLGWEWPSQEANVVEGEWPFSVSHLTLHAVDAPARPRPIEPVCFLATSWTDAGAHLMHLVKDL